MSSKLISDEPLLKEYVEKLRSGMGKIKGMVFLEEFFSAVAATKGTTIMNEMLGLDNRKLEILVEAVSKANPDIKSGKESRRKFSLRPEDPK